MEVSRSAIRVGIGQIAAGRLQTLAIAGELLFMRSESRTHTERHEETMAAMKAQQTQHLEIRSTLDVQRRAVEALIKRTGHR